MGTFLEALHSGCVLLMDGAMGTQLQLAGMQPGECFELWNLTHPDRVSAIHRAYVQAGAEAVLTNTFQAQTGPLVRRGLLQQIGDIWHAGVTLARAAATPPPLVLVSLGPGEWLWADVDSHCFAPFGRADALLLETLNDLHGVAACLETQRRMCGSQALPVLVSATYYRHPAGGFKTFTELTPEAFALQARGLKGIAALGVNCGRDISMEDCVEIVHRYRAATDLPLFARPNAGTPTQVDGRWVYPQAPEQMAGKLPALLKAGVAMVGGCCGTTPAHIAAFRAVVDRWNAGQRK